ncbi:MAG: hypothetical protein F4Y80_10830, partial [Caldilineaceae bacterium SB0665_bin_21]|nr:hypothetical protein [Caldilineaceae bacterium SB0665_bin_21]
LPSPPSQRELRRAPPLPRAPGAEPRLGLTALESVGIEVDPLNQRLKRLPAVRLKGVVRAQ